MDVENGERPRRQQSHPQNAVVAITTHLPLEQRLCDDDGNDHAAAAAAALNGTLPPRSERNNEEQQHSPPKGNCYLARFRSGPSIWMTLVAVTLAFSAGLAIGLSSCSCRLRRCSDCRSSNNSDAARPVQNETFPSASCQPKSMKNASSGGSSGSSASSSSNIDTSTSTPISDIEPPPLVVEVSSSLSSSCADHAAARLELRAAAEAFGRTFIQQFAYSIRQGGNHSFLLAFPDHVDVNGWIPKAETANTSAKDATQHATRNTTTIAAFSGHNQRRVLPVKASGFHRQLNARSTHDNVQARSTKMPMARRMPSTTTTNAGNPFNRTMSALQEADMVQTDPDSGDIYIAHATTNEVLVIQSATSAIRRRIRIPQRHLHSVVCGILLVADNNDRDGSDSLSPLSLWLVVLIQEVEYATWYGQDNYELESTNTTVLIYDAGATSTSDIQPQPIQRHSLPGHYNKAYAIGRHIHVMTLDYLDLPKLWDYLTPAYLQDTTISVHDIDPEHAPPLLLNESHYLQLAHEQLQRRLDPFVAEMATRLHCGTSGTGFVPLLHRPGRNDTNTAIAPADIFYTLHSLDVVAAASVATSALGDERHSQSQLWNMTSVLPPGASYLTTLVSDTRLVLSCQLWSGASLTTASQPLSYLVAFALDHASVVLSSVGVVPGAVTSTLAMDDTQDYLRIVTTRYDTFVDYNSQMGSDNSNTTSHAQVSILDLTAPLDNVMPMLGEWTTDFGHGQVVSSLFAPSGDFVAVAVQAANGSSIAAACALYTIDTTDPQNPRLVGEPLTVSVDTLDLYHMNDGWMIGMSYSYQHVPFDDDSTAQEPFQLFLFNVSSSTSEPLLGARLVDSWQAQQQATHFPNGTADLVFHIAQRYGYHYLNNVGLQVLNDSNVIVVPVFSQRYYSPLCPPSYKNGIVWTEDTNTPSHNQSEVPPPAQTKTFRATCPYEQSIVFDGFWLFEINVSNGTIDKLLEIDHAPYDFVPQPGCPSSSNGNYEFVPPRALGFTGDVLTVKRNAALSHDLLTKAEAAPAIVLQTNCNGEYNF